jgi:hypothetical protein
MEYVSVANRQYKLAELKGLLTAGLPELGPGPRAGIMPHGKLNAALDRLMQGSELPGSAQKLIRGLILLWHDHLEPAHEIAQAVENADGSFVHGILHRREPDYGNASYWFRRVGRHECFPKIARRVAELLRVENEAGMESMLIRKGEWDPYGFIGLCEKAVKGQAGKSAELIRQIQRIETEVLLEYLTAD